MPDSQDKPQIPKANVLDLRQVMAQRTAAAKATRPRVRPWVNRLRGEPEEVHRPGPNRDWRRVRREGSKFGLAIVGVAIPGVLLLGFVRLTQAANDVQRVGQDGFTSLRNGLTALSGWDSSAAITDFTRAGQQFDQADQIWKKALWHQQTWLQKAPVIGHKITSAAGLITAGQALARAGVKASQGIAGSNKPKQSVSLVDQGILQGSLGFLSPLLGKTAIFRSVIDDVGQASAAVTAVNPSDLPDQYRPYLRTWQELHPIFFGQENRLGKLYDMLVGLFAAARPQEYLILFQNDDELRPTGGFPGTYLLVDFARGQFSVLDSPVTGPYDLTSQNPKTSLPPQPILAVAPYWTFQDAAWFLDVPTSSEFVLDFYQQARGFRPDGVMYVTPHLIEDLLKITGPIRPPGYGIDITAENFLRATELQVEFGYDKALNNPKQFLLDLLPPLFQKLSTLSGPQAIQSFITLLAQASEENILMYSQDKSMEKTIQALGWDGALDHTTGDYLAVVDTNLGGGKTDRVMKETVAVTATVDGDTIRHEVTIKRKHEGKDKDVLTGVTNKTFVRLYAPSNAEFVSIDGASVPPDNFFFPAAPEVAPNEKLRAAEGKVLVDEHDRSRLTEENGRKVFGAWSILEPGASQIMTFVYTTPRPTSNQWNLTWQKQPGTIQRTWTVDLAIKSSGQITNWSPSAGQTDNKQRRVSWKTNSDVSRYFSATLK